MRFGLVGAGPWASLAYGPGLRSAEGVDLVGVWARRPEAAESLGGELGTPAYADYADLVRDVEAVAFAVPPAVQAVLAVDAARAGRHLLLDKPLALDPGAAADLAAAAEDVATVVFFTDRFEATSRDWFDGVAGGSWAGGWMRWFSALHEEGNPFGASPWRRERGALWDTGPHALSTLSTALGPVARVRATRGAEDLVHLVLSHAGGATSTVSLSQFTPPAAAHVEVTLWGEAGQTTMPARQAEPSEVLAVAARELVDCAERGVRHPVDARFGLDVVRLLAEADSQLSSRG